MGYGPLGARLLGQASVQNDLTLLGAASRIILGLTASSGNAQIETRKGGANNQSWADFQSDDATIWIGQHDTSENWNILDSSGNVVLQLQRAAGVAASMYLRAGNGVRIGSATGPLVLPPTTTTPEGAITAPAGSLIADTTGGVLYFKESGAGNTGWVAITTA